MNGNYFKNRHIVSIGVISIILILMIILVIMPAANRILSIKNEISQEQIALDKKLALGLNTKKTNEDLQKIEADLPKLDSIYINKETQLNLLTEIESLGANNQINVILKPDFTGQKVTNEITRVPITISATGKFNNLISFINSLDSAKWYFIGDELRLTKTTEENLNLELAGQIYAKTLKK